MHSRRYARLYVILVLYAAMHVACKLRISQKFPAVALILLAS